jgi:hypothetical protein
MLRSTAAVLSVMIVLTLGVTASAGESNELRASPGLWKTVYRTQVGGLSDPATFKWRCISEEQMDDPATAFAKPATVPGSCTRTGYTQTKTSINWQYHCVSGATILDSRGAIKFDTPLHYTGAVKVSGVVMGYPIEEVVAVEGEHRAACTSPED